jgi:hypothetical protein
MNLEEAVGRLKESRRENQINDLAYHLLETERKEKRAEKAFSEFKSAANRIKELSAEIVSANEIDDDLYAELRQLSYALVEPSGVGNQITGGKIVASSINAKQINAGSITSGQLIVDGSVNAQRIQY